MRSYLSALLLFAACSDDGQGSAKFTTWGEDYIEAQIPSDPSGEGGFVDGWTVKYDKFLVVFHGITVADATGDVAATMPGSKFVDNVVPGRKDLIVFRDLDARSWDRVSYQIKPALADSEVVAGATADRDMMVANGYSLYVAGSATKTGADGQLMKKTFHWGFKHATQYANCVQAEQGGQALEGIVITNGGSDVSELTTHGDHLFYDRLRSSPNPAVKTSLRFEEKAAADADQDGEITFDELLAQDIDVTRYDPSGFAAPTLGQFVSALARTVGHFRGEGECQVSEL